MCSSMFLENCGRDVVDALAVHVDLAPVAQRFAVFVAGSDHPVAPSSVCGTDDPSRKDVVGAIIAPATADLAKSFPHPGLAFP